MLPISYRARTEITHPRLPLAKPNRTPTPFNPICPEWKSRQILVLSLCTALKDRQSSRERLVWPLVLFSGMCRLYILLRAGPLPGSKDSHLRPQWLLTFLSRRQRCDLLLCALSLEDSVGGIHQWQAGTDLSVSIPLFALQYKIGQLYMISKHSHEQSDRGEGVEVVQNEPFEDPHHGNGQFTEKRVYLNR